MTFSPEGTSPEIYEVETDPRDKKIAEQEAEIARLKELAYKDPLTGLPNRRMLNEKVSQFLNQVETKKKYEKQRQEKDYSTVIVADIDHFKRINDTYGHKAGDEALIRASEALEKRFKIRLNTGEDMKSLVTRTGGEEFVMFLSNCKAEDAIARLKEFFNPETGDFEFTFDTGLVDDTGGAVVASFSFGLREFNHNEERDFDKILDEADQALYDAKGTGRRRLVNFSDIDIKKDNTKKE